MTDGHPTSQTDQRPTGETVSARVDRPARTTVRCSAWATRSGPSTTRPRSSLSSRCPPAHRDRRRAPRVGRRSSTGSPQERRRRPRLRIVHLAPEADVEARLRALRLGFDEALPTSVGAEELLGRLALLDERIRPRPGTTVRIADDVELDLVAHELRRGGRPIHLRPKEFNLLAMLAAHPGRAYTRRQLLDRVWGPDHHGDPRTVDVHVRWLRAKVEADPARPLHLVTLRGVGYRLDPPIR